MQVLPVNWLAFWYWLAGQAMQSVLLRYLPGGHHCGFTHTTLMMPEDMLVLV